MTAPSAEIIADALRAYQDASRTAASLWQEVEQADAVARDRRMAHRKALDAVDLAERDYLALVRADALAGVHA